MNVQEFSPNESETWEQVLPISQSVFGSATYAEILKHHGGLDTRLLVLESPRDGFVVAYPVVLRPTSNLSFGGLFPKPHWDIATPDYTGPMLVDGILREAANFPALFNTYCQSKGIIAEHAHLHPWHREIRCLDSSAIFNDREIVYVDLTLAHQTLWDEHFSYACRKNIRRSQKAGVRVFEAKNRDHIKEFHRIYIDTMERNHALGRYFYSLEYFQAFFERMPGNAQFMLAEHEGRIIAGTLYLHDRRDVFSFLGGADTAYQHLRPTNAVVYETIRWGQDLGKKRLILGGGYIPDDGIFRFKSSFSPLRAQFQVYRKIHMSDAYAQLCTAWERTHASQELAGGNYFPAYRR